MINQKRNLYPLSKSVMTELHNSGFGVSILILPPETYKIVKDLTNGKTPEDIKNDPDTVEKLKEYLLPEIVARLGNPNHRFITLAYYE